MYSTVFTFYVFFFDFHDDGVPPLEFFLFVDVLYG